MALPILLQPVDSQMLSEMGYLKSAETLFVRFRNNGAVYAYLGVAPEHWHRLRATASIGRYLQRNVLGQHRAVRISAGDKKPAKVA
jgi:hypothetical protein